MAAAAAAANGVSFVSSNAYLESGQVKETRALISNLCRQFYTLGWISGTGGSITAKVHEDSIPKSQQLIVMSPSGVTKERMAAEDVYVLSSSGTVLSSPSRRPYPRKPPKCTDRTPLFMKAYQMRDAGAVIHSHGRESSLITMIHPSSKQFRAAGYRYLFDAAIKLHQLGLDWSCPSDGPVHNVKGMWGGGRNINGAVKAVLTDNDVVEPSRKCILLDIEGTTTPISFVTDVLFPYARDNVRNHLIATYNSEETRDDIKLLRAQVEDDLEQGVVGSVPIPPADGGKEAVIASLVANVEAMIKADRKIPALKQLQGHIWRTGFQNKELQGVFFEDVPEALEKWHAMGIKVYIYSSGSREAQRLIFGNTVYGDLRKYLCGFFDTMIGNKKETRSYFEISQSVGVDRPSEILFLTDVVQEAVAAKSAGLEVMISIRPGNGPLPENHGFKTIKSFSEI
ncbi:probable bifunctional methylthioribulose-1-phosphate dehydratase/enolase-phosphatase E1 [Magnolia sinica]|uniref:probable bifunctional methylthioribulose-1-phosphate dehydratase/enolase-phosphatase E1 n=1 Tax=Magnolia sinica TaxID=86752 RepID=UPI00265A15F6|nr:probable bifunctional methylthioribulose-1-phosphate dehydratase/enolase-phosphatase E1 [Magnolia sinica]